MSNNKILKAMIIIAIIIIILIIIIISILNNKTDEKDISHDIQQSTMELSRVKERNDFFTVKTCVDRYVTYLTTKETDILYGYLDKQYVKENNITKNNVLNHIKTYNSYFKFKAKEMYFTQISSSLSQYFIYGELTEETDEEIGKKMDFYISIKIDKNNNTFSVIPDKYIDGMIVKDN